MALYGAMIMRVTSKPCHQLCYKNLAPVAEQK